MSDTMKRLKLRLLGKPLKSSEAESQRYGVLWGLPVLSSDAISSVAYATEEILIILIPVLGMASYKPMLGAGGTIILLLFMLILCYRQVIEAYPRGGGAYSVAKGNLGHIPSLVAASGLVIGYVLTIAVSACSGVAAIISAFPDVVEFKVILTIAFILLLTIGNLRGLRESSVLFGLPTYFFIASVLVMIVVGLFKAAAGDAPAANAVLVQNTQDLTLFLFLRAFSSGCSALTGVEAISNSVPNFSNPSQSNARKTLLILGLVVFVIFGGVCLLASFYQAVPQNDVTVVAQIAGSIFGFSSIMFYIIQIATAIILLMAANTAYNGLPQLMSLLAEDGYIPKRYASKGTRLVYSNGILFASALAIILVVGFHGETHLLIPLYAGGVFLSFTLAQSGMVVHWRTARSRGWTRKAAINGFGAVITALVTVVIITTRFTAGAWITLLAVFLLTLLMWSIKHHYQTVAENLGLAPNQKPRDLLCTSVERTQVVIPAYVINKPFIKTLNYARTLSDSIEIYHVKTSAAIARRLKAEYEKLDFHAPLIIEKAPYRNVDEVLLAHIDARVAELDDGETLTVVMPQLVTKWWQYPLHNQTTLALETELLGRRDVAVIMIPYIVERVSKK